MMNLDHKLELEQEWHESEDFARDANSFIVGVYASGVFAEAEAWHLAALGDVAGCHVLDYGCGTGGTTSALLARGARVTGFDISLLRLQEARQRTSAAPAAYVECAAEQLPFADAAFDAVLGKQVLHHLDLDVAVAEIARVLRPGGRAVFLEPLIHNPLLEGYRRLTPHLRSPTEKALSMADLARIVAPFRCWSHREFVLLSVLPALAAAKLGAHPRWTALQRCLAEVDRRLFDAVPAVGRYAWETVVVEK